ncbi:MAG: excinuclease ABC subunit C [Nitrospirae bacterium CG_4_9_14_0_8_um_filter_70_14]|nr:MAG: excinuclease ABC subunit C [Nitrospirae bacterium CG_4_9_14_0_8_um_filter_70_14]
MARRAPPELADLAHRPGIYLMKDGDGEVLYVGKAVDLARRVRSYFSRAEQPPKTRALVARIAAVETIIVDNEVEALLLEANLIKRYRPRYNVLLRDDKQYPYLRLSVQEEFPRIDVVRRVVDDGARYYGPFVTGTGIGETMSLINRTFMVRKCRNHDFRRKERPSLQFQIGRCYSPCTGRITPEEYARKVVAPVRAFLEGRDRRLVRDLTREMEEAAAGERFEEAARLRDAIRRIERLTARQEVVEVGGGDLDCLGLYRLGETTAVAQLVVRAGRLQGRRDLFMEGETGSEAELLAQVVRQLYTAGTLVPETVLVPIALPEHAAEAGYLTARRGRRCHLVVPRRGHRAKLIGLAQQNAREAYDGYQARRSRATDLLTDLKLRLGLSRLPRRIECFDISNVSGDHAVGSMVVFDEGRPLKRHYRNFRIRAVAGPNDFAMMAEVIERRYAGELADRLPYPDLILLDGGPPQLAAVVPILADLGLVGRCDLLGLAKARSLDGQGRGRGEQVQSHERLVRAGGGEPVVLPPDDPLCHLVARIRDEAHRFAITHYRKLHGDRLVASGLDGCAGIGPTRKVALLRHFGSLARVRAATVEELACCPKMTAPTAEAVYRYLRAQEADSASARDDRQNPTDS